MGDTIDPARFEKVDPRNCYGGGDDMLRNWPFDWPEVFRPNREGEFLSKIWAHYGPPNYIHFEGFTYCFHDRKTGLTFMAYSASSGPAFGGQFRKYDPVEGHIVQDDELSLLEDAVTAFEALLENTTPADCEVEFQTDFGLYRVGARNGIPFEEEELKR